MENALAWYKAQYEVLEGELSEFQASSKELEAELEKDLDAADKRERALREKAEGLSYEVEEWKVCHLRQRCRGTGAETAWLTHTRRGSTRSRNQRETQHKARSRRRSRPSAILTGRSSSGCATPKWPTMTSNARRARPRRRWKI